MRATETLATMECSDDIPSPWSNREQPPALLVNAIQSFVEPQRLSVVYEFCGHGLGRLLHDEPNIVHIGRPGVGVELRSGMFFTIEPMINLGKPQVKPLDDGWTAVTRDRSLSARFEHSLGVTATGCEVFTLSKRNAEKVPGAPEVA